MKKKKLIGERKWYKGVRRWRRLSERMGEKWCKREWQAQLYSSNASSLSQWSTLVCWEKWSSSSSRLSWDVLPDTETRLIQLLFLLMFYSLATHRPWRTDILLKLTTRMEKGFCVYVKKNCYNFTQGNEVLHATLHSCFHFSQTSVKIWSQSRKACERLGLFTSVIYHACLTAVKEWFWYWCIHKKQLDRKGCREMSLATAELVHKSSTISHFLQKYRTHC